MHDTDSARRDACESPIAAAGDVHETDVLKRRRFFSWSRFGGEGFLVSVAFHLLLVIAGVFWIVSRFHEAKPVEDPTFDVSGGGNNGTRAMTSTEKLTTRPQPVLLKQKTRIVAKGGKPEVTLPSVSATSTMSFASGLSAGSGSKGSGGGAHGGSGGGFGPGSSKAGHMVSMFGGRGLHATGLVGYFYDFKQTPKGEPTRYASGDAASALVDQVLRPFVRRWDRSEFDGKFFRAPEALVASQVFIPSGDAGAAPKAFSVDDKVKPSRWAAIYSGKVTAPKSGKFRFWGLGDDVMVVRWASRIALDSGWALLTQGRGHNNHAEFHDKPVLGATALKQGRPSVPFRAGPWFDVTAGQSYPIDVLISEVPGGAFGGWLLMEEADASGKGDGKLFLFRMGDDIAPGSVKNDTGLEVDMAGKGLIWRAAKRPARVS